MAELAEYYLGDIHPRWEHVRGVGSNAHLLYLSGAVSFSCLQAAWLHDIGYAREARTTGFHPLDGAAFLKEGSAPLSVVSLVAWHTGAAYEAIERGLYNELRSFPLPNTVDAENLTLLDLTVDPFGYPIGEVDRIREILNRYEPGHPVHEAVRKSGSSLIATAVRARRRLGLPNNWPAARKGVTDSVPH